MSIGLLSQKDKREVRQREAGRLRGYGDTIKRTLMPCERVKIGDAVAIVCSSRAPRKRCRWCQEWSVALCDASAGPRKTCDAPMCEKHRKQVGPNQDLCPDHALAAISWPADRQALSVRGYRLKYARKCRLCNTQIEFWSTPNDKLLPLDKTVNDLRVSHWQTCPKAEEFRKKNQWRNGLQSQ